MEQEYIATLPMEEQKVFQNDITQIRTTMDTILEDTEQRYGENSVEAEAVEGFHETVHESLDDVEKAYEEIKQDSEPNHEANQLMEEYCEQNPEHELDFKPDSSEKELFGHMKNAVQKTKENVQQFSEHMKDNVQKAAYLHQTIQVQLKRNFFLDMERTYMQRMLKLNTFVLDREVNATKREKALESVKNLFRKKEDRVNIHEIERKKINNKLFDILREQARKAYQKGTLYKDMGAYLDEVLERRWDHLINKEEEISFEEELKNAKERADRHNMEHAKEYTKSVERDDFER